MKRLLKFMCFTGLIFTLAGCSDSADTPTDTSGAQTDGGLAISLIQEYPELNWGDTVDEVRAYLDGKYEYEVTEPDETTPQTTIQLTGSAEYQGLSAERFLRFAPLTSGESVLMSVTYAFESYEDIYAELQGVLGEPSSVENEGQANEQATWDGAKMSELYSDDVINDMYESELSSQAGELTLTVDAVKESSAETISLWNVDGSGYLIDDGSYIAAVNNLTE